MKFNSVTLIFFTALFLSACTKPEEEMNNTEPLLLQGSVLLADEGNVLVDKSGMTISVENSNPLITATTDLKGEFKLAIPPSIKSFALVYSKSTYGTFKRFYEKRGDTLYKSAGEFEQKWHVDGNIKDGFFTGESLGYKSTVIVNSFKTSVVNGKLRITCNISSPNVTGEKFIRFFYAKNLPDISFDNVPKTVKNMGMPFPVNNGDNVIEMCMSCLYQCADMKSGETVYITAYGDSFYSNLYRDITTNTLAMPNVNLNNKSTPVSFVLP